MEFQPQFPDMINRSVAGWAESGDIVEPEFVNPPNDYYSARESLTVSASIVQ